MKDREAAIEKCAGRIRANWMELVPTILDTAALCADANRRFKRKGEKSLLLEKLPFSPSVFSMLVQIGNDPRLRQEAVVQLLPANYSTIYRFTQVSDEQLNQAIGDNVLHPRVSRDEVDVWLGKQKGKIRKLRLPKGLHAGVRFPQTPTRMQLERLEELLDQISTGTGAEIIRPARKHSKGWNAWQNKILSYMQKQVKKMVKEATPSGGSLLDRFGIDEEMHVSRHSSEDDLRAIIETLGGDSLQLEIFRDEAIKIYPEPALPEIDVPFVDVPMTEGEIEQTKKAFDHPKDKLRRNRLQNQFSLSAANKDDSGEIGD